LSDDYGEPALSVAVDYNQDPDSILDYEFAWAAKLNGDTIATSAFIFEDGLAEASSSNTDTTTTVFINAAGGGLGGIYRVTNRITTAGGRTMDKTIRILISEE
jgi:hypothetical protein